MTYGMSQVLYTFACNRQNKGNMTTLEKYVWIVSTLYRAGDKGLSLKELNEKWIRDENISNGEPLPRQTFDRWKGNILMSLGVDIDCRRKGGYRYHIANPDSLKNGELSRWLLDTFATAHSLSHSTALKDRILVDDIPSSHDFLTDIIAAMNENRIIEITHQSFHRDAPSTFPVAPYCLRMFQRRWYLLGKSINDERIRLYGLDRVMKVEMTDSTFSLPEDFDAKEYFANSFGVIVGVDIPVQRIVIRVQSPHQYYMRTLPLHKSQKVLSANSDHADFELTLRPTYDFCMELLRAGDMIEVLEPESLRHEMYTLAKNICDIYRNDEKTP